MENDCVRRYQRQLWALIAITPLVVVLCSYMTFVWSWGLMDDLQLLTLPGGTWDRVVYAFRKYLAFGEFKPVFAAHSALVYQVFADSPRALHIFKLVEIGLMLALWGRAAARITGERLAFWLVPAIAFSFSYLYDQFYFLSTHETLGLLFAGLAVNLMIPIVNETNLRRRAWLMVLLAVILACSFFSKETMVAAGAAGGISLMIAAAFDRRSRRPLLWSGIVLTVAVFVYALWLKLAVSSSYTSGYKLTDFPTIIGNLIAWGKKDFIHHVPWIGLAALLWWKGRGRQHPEFSGTLMRWGIVLGALLYTGHLLILLPWNTTSYYAGPLGVYFAFTAAILIARSLAELKGRLVLAIAMGALGFNLLIVSYTLDREKTYHANTQDLWEMIRGNASFCQAARKGLVVTNGMEAGMAIPGHANRWWGLGLPVFTWSPNFPDIENASFEYYVFSPRFGASVPGPASRWQIEFNSRFWKVYRKL